MKPTLGTLVAGLMLAGALFVGGFAAQVAAFDAVWDAGSGLPDVVCSPWTLGDTAAPEEPFLAGGVLTISTDADAEKMFYQHLDPAVDVPNPLVMETRMRLVSGSSSSDTRAPALVAFTTSPGVGNILLVKADEISLLATGTTVGDTAAVDTDDAFHTYRIEVNGTSVEVFYDDVSTLTGSTVGSVGTFQLQDRIVWGEGSGVAHGTSEWEFFNHNASTDHCGPVGGIAELPAVAQSPQEAAEASGATLTFVVVGALAAVALAFVALAGAARHARRSGS